MGIRDDRLIPSGGAPDGLTHASPPFEDEYFEDGFGFVVEDGGVTITRHRVTPVEQHITVPSHIAGLPVRRLGTDSFRQHRRTVSITLPDGLETIESGAFYRCYSLEAMHIPASVTTIEGYPFYRSSALTAITVDPANPGYSSIGGVLFDKACATMLCYPEARAQAAYEIPRSVVRVIDNAFGYHCLYLKEVILPIAIVELPDKRTLQHAFRDELTLIVEPYSSAEWYAQDLGLRYRLADGTMYD
jgi:hypothetical protein